MKLEKVVKSDLRLSPGLDNSEIGVVPGIVVVLKFQIEQWAKGNSGLNVKDNLIEEKAEEFKPDEKVASMTYWPRPRNALGVIGFSESKVLRSSRTSRLGSMFRRSPTVSRISDSGE